MYEATYSKLFQATVQIPAAKVAEKAPALHRLCSVHSFSLRDWSSPSQAKADMCNIQGLQGHTANPQTYARRLPLPSMSAWKLELWELVRPWGHGTNDTTAIAACCRKLSASGHATRIAASTQGGERGETLERSAMPCHAMPWHAMPCRSSLHQLFWSLRPYGLKNKIWSACDILCILPLHQNLPAPTRWPLPREASAMSPSWAFDDLGCSCTAKHNCCCHC